MKTIEYIKNNGLKSLTENLGIAVKEYTTENGEKLFLLDYNQIDSPKTDIVVMECRSLIIDERLNIVSRSFDRFFNFGEAPDVVGVIDWDKAVIYPKIDGSLIKIYCYKSFWYVSTRGTAFAESKVGGFDITFKELVFKALGVCSDAEFQILCNELLNPDNTYICEVTSAENRVVTKYEGYNLWQLAVRENATGRYKDDLGLYSCFANKPEKLKFSSAEDCQDSATKLPNLEEGYVVYVDGVPRCKIKSPAYVAVHHLRDNGVLNPKRVCKLVLLNETEEYLSYFPEDEKFFTPYIHGYEVLFSEVEQAYDMYKGIESQKDFAIAIKDAPFKSVLFTARKFNLDVKDAFIKQTENYQIEMLISYKGN